MNIWPAIDLRNGKCVRLQQGDYSRETVFGDDPVAMAQRLISEGAEQLHLVDLDGARDGHWANRTAVEAVVAAVEAAAPPASDGTSDIAPGTTAHWVSFSCWWIGGAASTTRRRRTTDDGHATPDGGTMVVTMDDGRHDKR